MKWIIRLILKAPSPQNVQTHSNNSSAAAADELLEFVGHSVGLAFKGRVLFKKGKLCDISKCARN